MEDAGDDDFQSPTPSIQKRSQAVIASSIQDTNAQALKPSNGARSRKRSRLPAPSGKENRRSSQVFESGALGSNEACETMPMGAQRRKHSALIELWSVGSSPISFPSCRAAFDCFSVGKNVAEDESLSVLGSNERDLMESRKRTESDSKFYSGCDLSSERYGKKVDNSNLLKIHRDNLVDHFDVPRVTSGVSEVCRGKQGLRLGEGSYYSMSIESRLLGSTLKSVSDRDESGTLDGDGCGDFQPGTQLNVLMNLCSEIDENANYNGVGVEGSELHGNVQVECPLCGVDISNLSQEMRHTHTNDCLDKRGNESRLTEFRINYDSKGDGHCFGENYCQKEESDIVLNTSTNLFSKIGEESRISTGERDFNMEMPQMKSHGMVECPLCGVDISDFSAELRHTHTNNCLEENESSQPNPVGSGFPELQSKSYTIGEGSAQGAAVGELKTHMSRDMLLSSVLQMSRLVECPLCSTDITGLNEELRQAHTNDCLDKEGNAQVTVPCGETKPNSPRQVVNINPVLEWIRSLGLSRYEETFSREEIDWDTLQWLREEDLLNMGITALGPRKKIAHALAELRRANDNNQEIEEESFGQNTKLSTPGNKLITEYFQGAAVERKRICSHNKRANDTKNSSNDSVHRRAAARDSSSKQKVKNIPTWCHIPGTPFRVDAFRYLRRDCSHWFLTHFHIDHYQGLTRNFCHGMIYCSSITAHLVNTKLGVPWDKLHILPLDQKVTIAGVNLTCFDANHCPGSIIILFELSNGKAVLHTGDFRFSEEMARNSILQSCHVHTLILDTTYCNPQYDFPTQESVIQFVIEAIQAETFNPKTLFLIGSYTIGKEKIFLEVARLLKKKIYVGAAKLHLLSCLELPEEDMHWFTANEMESHIHMVPMWTIASFKRMKHITDQYSGRFNLFVAFSPTGWTFGKGKKKTPGRRWQQGTIIRYEVPYSEHSSFSELREFVRFISPENIIPSVNNDGPESANAMIAHLMSNA